MPGTVWNNVVTLFVYGTLRKDAGGALLIGERDRAVMPGRLYYAPGTRTYPVLTPPEEATDTVVGECVDVDLDDLDALWVIGMELAAGYSLTQVTATLSSGAVIHCLAFTWHRSDGLGDRIDSGDWLDRSIHIKDTHYKCTGCGVNWNFQQDAISCAEYDARHLTTTTGDN